MSKHKGPYPATNISALLSPPPQFLPKLDNSFLGLSASPAGGSSSSTSSTSSSNNNALGIMTTTSSNSNCSDSILADGDSNGHMQQQQQQQLSDEGQALLAQLMQESKSKIAELRNGIKNVEGSSARLSAHLNRAQSEVTKAFHLFSTLLEERRSEVMRELEAAHSARQLALSLQAQRAQDTIEKVAQVGEYAEQLAKSPSASAADAATYRKALEQRLRAVLAAHHEASLGAAGAVGAAEDASGAADFDFDFVGPSYPTAQSSIKSTFGYVRKRTDSGNSTNSGSGGSGGSAAAGVHLSNGGTVAVTSSGVSSAKQPPISRPLSSGGGALCNGVSGGVLGLSPLMATSSSSPGSGAGVGGSSGLAAGILAALDGGATSLSGSLHGLLDRQQQQQQQQQQQHAKAHQTPPAAGGSFGGQFQAGMHSTDSADIFAKRGGGFPSSSSSSSLGDLSSLGVNGVVGSSASSNPYEKWSDGGAGAASKLLFGSGAPGDRSDPASVAAAAAAQAAVAAAAHHAHLAALSSGHHHHHGSGHHHHHSGHHSGHPHLSSSSGNSAALLDLSSKLLNTPMFPPKSQIKRQKMIYHCKFGEFGVLEGQFTEPSGVAVNAQNDIIVADTNNHRIQIFDKEGRFKFQFGECGKRDGQLLYPNRVAVVRQSGDIIVTERSPTHQVQIYNQYGQFVRKFGATSLQHPRGVCVDNKGRIVVVECKVMRVIIFDQVAMKVLFF